MLRTIAAIAAVVVLVACTDTASEGPATDPAKTAAVQTNIEEFCADGTLSFCDELTQATNGRPDVAVSSEGLLLIVGIHASAEADADSICHTLAAMHYDGDGKDLGYKSVTVISGGHEVASCHIP